MPAELKGKITIDAESVDRAKEKTREFGQTIEDFYKRQAGPGRRAELAITGALRELLSGDVVGGVERLIGRMTALGLGASVAFGGIAAALIESNKHAKEFTAHLDEVDVLLTKMPALGANLEAFKKHFSELSEKTKPTEPIWQRVGKMIPSPFGQDTRAIQEMERAGKQQVATFEQLMGTLGAIQHQHVLITEAQKEEASYAEKVNAIWAEARDRAREIGQHTEFTKEQTKQLIEASEAARKAELARLAVATYAAANKQVEEKTGVTTQELLQAGQLAPKGEQRTTFPVALQGEAYLLGIAQRAQAEGERLRKLGFPEQAKQYFAQAADITKDLKSLKPSEREDAIAFKTALDTSTKLTEAVNHLENIAKNTSGGIDLTNK